MTPLIWILPASHLSYIRRSRPSLDYGGHSADHFGLVVGGAVGLVLSFLPVLLPRFSVPSMIFLSGLVLPGTEGASAGVGVGAGPALT